MKIRRMPRKAVAHKGHGTEAWWYENAKSIDVYIHEDSMKRTLVARVKRADLADWLKRTEQKP